MPQQPITLTAYEFWSYVKDDTDCDEVLELLGGHNELISHFLYFSSIAHTLDDLDKLVKKKKKEIGHVYTELTQSPEFRRLTASFVQRQHRLHPYRRSSTPSRTTRVALGDSPFTPINVDLLMTPPHRPPPLPLLPRLSSLHRQIHLHDQRLLNPRLEPHTEFVTMMSPTSQITEFITSVKNSRKIFTSKKIFMICHDLCIVIISHSYDFRPFHA
jgi:hypothetical protein